ncbi:hypothetical protein LXL04_036832 [Taraxacum kok-saghyz]
MRKITGMRKWNRAGESSAMEESRNEKNYWKPAPGMAPMEEKDGDGGMRNRRMSLDSIAACLFAVHLHPLFASALRD